MLTSNRRGRMEESVCSARDGDLVNISISRIVADFFIMLCCAIPLLIFHEFVKPYKRGFYCDDESIRYPFRESTVSRQMLIVVGLIIPTLLIFVTEVFRASAWERKCSHQFKAYRCREYSVHRLIVRLYVFLGYFMLGVVFNQLMVDIAKYTIGRQRPHFIDVCKPKGFETCPLDRHEYITDFECTGTDKKLVHESMLSFYSGHSAFSFYAAWYTALYLQARLYRPLFSRLLLPVIQFALFGGAAFVAYTRVSNYKHHWSDVLIGAIMGSAIGIVVAVFVAEVFSRREIPECELDGEGGIRDRFGVVRFQRAPIADMESGLQSQPASTNNNVEFTTAHAPTTADNFPARYEQHVVTVTRELKPTANFDGATMTSSSDRGPQLGQEQRLGMVNMTSYSNYHPSHDRVEEARRNYFQSFVSNASTNLRNGRSQKHK